MIFLPYNVLIVDDDEYSKFELKQVINWEEAGFSIINEANDGFSALKELEKEKYHMVITDIKMPGMSGLDLLNEIRKKNLCDCVVLISLHEDFNYARKGLVLGAFDYVVKPLTPSKVLDVVKRAYPIIKNTNNRFDKNVFSNDLYLLYPHEKVDFILTNILKGNDVGNLAGNLFQNLYSACNKNLQQTAIITNSICLNLTKTINTLNHLDFSIFHSIDFYRYGAREITNYKTGKNAFIKTIKDILNAVAYYNLDTDNQLIKDICKHIINNIDKRISLSSISEKFFLSKNYLCSLFKKKTGENIVEYITKIRIERAKLLLRDYNYKINEVSDQLGFSDTNYFSRTFKKYADLSPSEYKQKVRYFNKTN